jgi:hypothetical protein
MGGLHRKAEKGAKPLEFGRFSALYQYLFFDPGRLQGK